MAGAGSDVRDQLRSTRFSAVTELPALLDSLLGRGYWTPSIAERVQAAANDAEVLRVMALRMRNRACSRATALPREVLGMIFIELGDIDIPLARSRKSVIGDEGWLRVLWVCVDWRTAALAERALFARNISHLPAAFQRLRPLAGNHSLVYRATMSCPRMASEVDIGTASDNIRNWIFFTNFPFVRAGVIDIDSRVNVPQSLRDLILRSTSKPLRRLEAIQAYDCKINPNLDSSRRALVASNGLELQAPQLREALFRNTWCAQDAPRLEIYSVVYTSHALPRPTTLSILRSLAHSAPTLRKLTLIHCCDPHYVLNIPVAIVKLPRLEYVRLTARTQQLEDLVSTMSWPPSTRVELRTTIPGDPHSGLHYLDSVLKRVGTTIMVEVEFDLSKHAPNSYLRVTARIADTMQARIVVELILMPTAPVWVEVVRLIIHQFGNHGIQMLALYTANSNLSVVKAPQWIGLFESLPHVTAIYPRDDVVQVLEECSPYDAHPGCLISRLRSMTAL